MLMLHFLAARRSQNAELFGRRIINSSAAVGHFTEKISLINFGQATPRSTPGPQPPKMPLADFPQRDMRP